MKLNYDEITQNVYNYILNSTTCNINCKQLYIDIKNIIIDTIDLQYQRKDAINKIKCIIDNLDEDDQLYICENITDIIYN